MLIRSARANLHPPHPHSEVKFKQICHLNGQGLCNPGESFLFSPLMLKRDSGGGSLVHQLFDIKLPHCFNITDVRYCSEAYWRLSSEIKRPYFFDGKQPTGDSVAFSLYMRPRFTKHVCSARAWFTRTTKCSQNFEKSKIPFLSWKANIECPSRWIWAIRAT